MDPYVHIHQCFTSPQPFGEASKTCKIDIRQPSLKVGDIKRAVASYAPAVFHHAKRLVLFAPIGRGRIFLSNEPAAVLAGLDVVLALPTSSEAETFTIENNAGLLPHLVHTVSITTSHFWLRFPSVPGHHSLPGGGHFLPEARFPKDPSRVRTAELTWLVHQNFGFDRDAVFRAVEDIKKEHQAELLFHVKRKANKAGTRISQLEAAQGAGAELRHRGRGYMAPFVIDRIWQTFKLDRIIEAETAPLREAGMLAFFKRRRGSARPPQPPQDDAMSIFSASTIVPRARPSRGGAFSVGGYSCSYASTTRSSSPDDDMTDAGTTYNLRSSARRPKKSPLKDVVDRYFASQRASVANASRSGHSELASVVMRSASYDDDDDDDATSVAASTIVPARPAFAQHRGTPSVAGGSVLSSIASTIGSRMDWEATSTQEQQDEVHLEQLEASAEYLKTMWQQQQLLSYQKTLEAASAEAAQVREQMALCQQQRVSLQDEVAALAAEVQRLQVDNATNAEAMQMAMEQREAEAALSFENQQRAEAAFETIRKFGSELEDTLSCGVCFERYGTLSQDPEQRSLHLTCGHSWCHGCLHRHFEERERSGDQRPVSCPFKCANVVPIYDTVSENYTVQKIIELWNEYRRSAEMMN